MASKPILYTYFRSSCSWRLRIGLAIKGIDYESRTLELLKQEHLQEEFLKLNPMGQVPALLVDGKILTQSVAVLEFLEEKYPQPALFPEDAFERAKVREIVEHINSGIQPIANLSVTQKHSEDPKEKIAWMNYWVIRGFQALEKVLEKTAGEYCVGNKLTMADIFLVPQVANADRWKVDMSPFPVISGINERLSALQPFQVAHFSKQPDCPEELRT